MDEFFPEDAGKLKPSGYWNKKENIILEARKYNTKKEFEVNNKSAYHAAIKNGWIKELYPDPDKKPNGYWTYDKCKKAANTCKTRSEYAKKYNTAYNLSNFNGWLDEFFPIWYLNQYKQAS